MLSVPAKATVYYIDSGNPLGTGTYNFDAQVTKKTASFFDEWRFTLASLSNAESEVVNVISGQGKNISGLYFSLFSANANYVIQSAVAGCTSVLACSAAGLASGQYVLHVGGSGTGNGGGAYDGTLTITAVPLPPAAILFGSVLFGLAVVGRRRLAGGAQAV